MKKTIFTKSADITEITIKDKCLTDYFFVEEKTVKKLFGKKEVIPEHYEHHNYAGHYTEHQILNFTNYHCGCYSHMIVGKKVYEKALVSIRSEHFKNTSFYYKYFDTFEQAESWANNIIKENGLNESLVKIKY